MKMCPPKKSPKSARRRKRSKTSLHTHTHTQLEERSVEKLEKEKKKRMNGRIAWCPFFDGMKDAPTAAREN